MIGRAFLILVASTISAAALASDNRIRTLPYEPDQIVRITGRTGIQSTIEFGRDERIENVAVGDSSAWQVTPNKRANLLFVKPLAPSSRTNMTVVTDKRTYLFELVTGARESAPLYALRFSYTDIEFEIPMPQAEVVVAARQEPTALGPAPHRLNFGWRKKGTDSLLPLNVFDDGASLYLTWDRRKPLPAISTLTDDRREGALNYAVSGEYIVISPVPDNISLRYGKRSATVWRTEPVHQTAPATSTPSRAVTLAQGPIQRPIIGGSQMHAIKTPHLATGVRGVPSPRVAIPFPNFAALHSDHLTDKSDEQ